MQLVVQAIISASFLGVGVELPLMEFRVLKKKKNQNLNQSNHFPDLQIHRIINLHHKMPFS